MKTSFTITPFQGLVSWRCHFIQLYGMLADYALSGLFGLLSPEGARYANDGHSPSEKKTKNKISPEGA